MAKGRKEGPWSGAAAAAAVEGGREAAETAGRSRRCVRFKISARRSTWTMWPKSLGQDSADCLLSALGIGHGWNPTRLESDTTGYFESKKKERKKKRGHLSVTDINVSLFSVLFSPSRKLLLMVGVHSCSFV